MARFPTLMALLVTMFVIAACGGPEDSERAASSEPQQTQTESSPESAQEDAESSGLMATTIDGEEVELGAQGDVTALFFMAGW